MQHLLTRELRRAGRAAGLRARGQPGTLINGMTADGMVCNVHIANRVSGKLPCGNATMLVGHSPVAQEIGDSANVDWPGATRNDTLLVTMFREPESRVESQFRYHSGGGKEFAMEVQKRNGDLQVEFENKIKDLQALKGTAKSSAAVRFHTPPLSYTKSKSRLRASHHDLSETKNFIVDWYSVVGVLDRMEETLEVMRCRVPWFNADEIPASPNTAQTWEYPVKLVHPPSLKELVGDELELYALANEVLTADVQCCRGHKHHALR